MKEYNVYNRLYVETGGILTDKNRKELIHTIISYTTDNRIWVPQNQYVEIFEMVKKYFKEETLDIWYCPKSKGQKNPTGDLFMAFRNERARLSKDFGITKNYKQSKENAQVSTAVMDTTSEGIRKELLSRYEPWDRIKSDWKETFDYRRNEIMTKKLVDIFRRWPKYCKEKGKEFVSIFNFYLYFANKHYY